MKGDRQELIRLDRSLKTLGGRLNRPSDRLGQAWAQAIDDLNQLAEWEPGPSGSPIEATIGRQGHTDPTGRNIEQRVNEDGHIRRQAGEGLVARYESFMTSGVRRAHEALIVGSTPLPRWPARNPVAAECCGQRHADTWTFCPWTGSRLGGA
jgi:hypothetical protein